MRTMPHVAAWMLWLTAASCGATRLGENTNGLPVHSAIAERGEVVFMQRCHKCHPGGEAGLGPSLNGKPLPGFLMHFQIRHGLGAMPSFDSDLINGAQLAELLAYLSER
jgi:mono/diheme cytochrome c family protein